MLRELREDVSELWDEADVFERVLVAVCLPMFVVAWLIVFVIRD
jgi:hypothetical protein